MIQKFTDNILWQRAQDYVHKHRPILIGIAGGFDKTLTREAMAHVLQQNYRVRSIDTDTTSRRELALAILGNEKPRQVAPWWKLLIGSRIKEAVEAEPQVIVIEVAVKEPGDIDSVARALPFSMAVLLNVASVSLDLFQNKSNVAHELLSLPISLRQNGFSILNLDDPFLSASKERLKNTVITFGEHPEGTVRLVRAQRLGIKGFAGEIAVGNRTYPFSLPHILGRHQLSSILSALAITHAQHQNIEQAINSLRNLKTPAGHLRSLIGKNHSLILDDSHDATLESTIAALKTLHALPEHLVSAHSTTPPRKIAIIGDIAGLGSTAPHAHREIAQELMKTTDICIAVGKEMRATQAIMLKEGNIDTHHFETSQEAGKWVVQYLKPRDIVLVKGSRHMHMEHAVKYLLANPEKDSGQLVHHFT